MRLMVPLAICNTVMFVFSNAVALVVRTHRAELAPHTASALLEAITVVSFSDEFKHDLALVFQVIFLQPPFSLLIYMRYCNKLKRTTDTNLQHDETDVYFTLFQKQLDAAYMHRC